MTTVFIGGFMDLLKFLDEAVTPWHTSSAISKELLLAGFQELTETETWNLQREKFYFVNSPPLKSRPTRITIGEN